MLHNLTEYTVLYDAQIVEEKNALLLGVADAEYNTNVDLNKVEFDNLYIHYLIYFAILLISKISSAVEGVKHFSQKCSNKKVIFCMCSLDYKIG